MLKRISVFGLSSILIISLISQSSYAQVYTEQVDMLCPDYLLGSWFDFGETRDWIHICPINEERGGGGNPDPVPACPDSDGDVIDDCSDLCPLEPETVNFFEDDDGCPDVAPEDPLIPVNPLSLLFQAFGNTITTTPNSIISNQQILIQWNNGEDIIVQKVTNADSPFTFTYEILPVLKQGSNLPLSQNNVIYNVEVPAQVCGSVVTNECIQLVRYEIPTTVFGIINGTTVADDTFIIIDLSDDDFDPNLLLLFLLLLIPLIGVLFRRRKKKKNKRVGVRTFLQE